MTPWRMLIPCDAILRVELLEVAVRLQELTKRCTKCTRSSHGNVPYLKHILGLSTRMATRCLSIFYQCVLVSLISGEFDVF